MILSRRTWISLLVLDVIIWVIAEVQDTGGTLGSVFDVIWIVSFLGFFALLLLGAASAIRARRQPPA